MKRRSSNPSTPRFIERHKYHSKLSLDYREMPREVNLITNVSPDDNSPSIQAMNIKKKLAKWDERNKVWLKKRSVLEKKLKHVEGLEVKASKAGSNVSDLFEKLCVLYKGLCSELSQEKKKTSKLTSELLTVKKGISELQEKVEEFTKKGRCEIGQLDGAQDTTRLQNWFSRSRSNFSDISRESEQSEGNSMIYNIVELLDQQ